VAPAIGKALIAAQAAAATVSISATAVAPKAAAPATVASQPSEGMSTPAVTLVTEAQTFSVPTVATSVSSSIITAAFPAVPLAEIVPAQAPLRTTLYRKFRLPEFTYKFDQWTLSPVGEDAIVEIAEQLRLENKWFIIKIEGHSDSIGTDEYNFRLSQKRAISAAIALVVKAGFDPTRIFLRGYGESKAIADNLTAEGRAENRRVEILVLLPKEGPQ
jgi:outer membrane protein OmpA-like peptidoglycan-associated protein